MSTEQTPLINHSSTSLSPPPTTRTPSSTSNLTKFRTAIGINGSPSSSTDLESARKSPQGLYKEIIATQTLRSRQYVAVETLYYLALLAQILIGATLVSLGPMSRLHPTAITILGIVNTSTAGILALLKGQGLPDRLRKDEFQMKKVQDFIEETEIRLVVAGEDALGDEELEKVVEQIFEKYNSAIDTAEMNRPSSYAHQVEGTVGGSDGASEANGNVKRNVVMGNKVASDGNAKGKGKYVID